MIGIQFWFTAPPTPSGSIRPRSQHIAPAAAACFWTGSGFGELNGFRHDLIGCSVFCSSRWIPPYAYIIEGYCLFCQSAMSVPVTIGLIKQNSTYQIRSKPEIRYQQLSWILLLEIGEGTGDWTALKVASTGASILLSVALLFNKNRVKNGWLPGI